MGQYGTNNCGALRWWVQENRTGSRREKISNHGTRDQDTQRVGLQEWMSRESVERLRHAMADFDAVRQFGPPAGAEVRFLVGVASPDPGIAGNIGRNSRDLFEASGFRLLQGICSLHKPGFCPVLPRAAAVDLRLLVWSQKTKRNQSVTSALLPATHLVLRLRFQR